MKPIQDTLENHWDEKKEAENEAKKQAALK